MAGVAKQLGILDTERTSRPRTALPDRRRAVARDELFGSALMTGLSLRSDMETR